VDAEALGVGEVFTEVNFEGQGRAWRRRSIAGLDRHLADSAHVQLAHTQIAIECDVDHHDRTARDSRIERVEGLGRM
jgi:hypothetical protein